MAELEHLYRILSDMPKGKDVAAQIKGLMDTTWIKGKLIKNGQRVLDLAFYPEQVELMTKLLLDCRNAPKTRAVEEAIAETKAGGKDLFEE